ncbi:Restriction endonuclease [Azoarcus sp. Aa7]|nr:Restriction endonuclease [Azoarcus sp. Aa7]
MPALLIVLVVGLILWDKAPWLLVLVVLLIAFCMWLFQIDENNKRRALSDRIAAQREAVRACVARHIKVLLRKYSQSVYRDDYGNYVFDKWWAECDYFVSTVVSRECPEAMTLGADSLREEVSDAVLSDMGEDEDTSLELPEGMSPIEFEHYCARILREAGWDARVTRSSGDQGVDVLAEFDGKRAVFQCKLYSTPVGNAAVQEIIAGREYEKAEIAGVISNNTFTSSARQLAEVSGIHLVHFSELSDLARALVSAR